MKLLALAGGVLLAVTQSGDARETAREVLSDPSYQVELPGEKAIEARREKRTARAERGVEVNVPTGSLFTLLAWGALFVCLVLAGAWLAQVLGGYRGNAALAPPARAPAPDSPGLAGRILSDAEALAADGRYAEAIHVLLLRVFEALASRGSNVQPSATSRELLAGLALAPEQKGALERLVTKVEQSLFGTHSPDRSDYEGCRRCFEVLERTGGNAGA
jgi:hypothetical protein